MVSAEIDVYGLQGKVPVEGLLEKWSVFQCWARVYLGLEAWEEVWMAVLIVKLSLTTVLSPSFLDLSKGDLCQISKKKISIDKSKGTVNESWIH